MRTGLGWDIDPDFPIWLWKAEVADGDTRKGYVEWVDQKKEAREVAAWRPSGGFGGCGCCGSVADVDQIHCFEPCDAEAYAQWPPS